MTNNKQQTAVEWFLDQLIEHRIIIVDKTTYQVKYRHEILLEQAKEMEKEKTIKFTEDWYFNGPLLGEGIDVKSTIEQHFNNTYGGGEQ
jgi:hypothetical protein